jgi:hypothetical protein
MLPKGLAALLGLGSIGLIGWGLIEGPAILLIGGGVLLVISGVLLYGVRVSNRTLTQLRKRPRGWGQPLSDEDKRYYGSRLVFEPFCLKPSCGGPVVELINRAPPHPGPFLAPDYYVQGSARCIRCKQRYVYTIVSGVLRLQMPDGERLSQSFDPL